MEYKRGPDGRGKPITNEVELQETLANNLHFIRMWNQITPEDVFKNTGIPASSLAKYEKAETRPNAISVAKLAWYYQVSADWLFGFTNNTPHLILDEDEDEDLSEGDIIQCPGCPFAEGGQG